jgi:acid phosphatase type 7
MPTLGGENAGYGPKFLYDHFGPVLRDAGADLMISGHMHRHSWLDESSSGLGFPILINSNTSYVTVDAGRKMLSVRVVSDKEETVLTRDLPGR